MSELDELVGGLIQKLDEQIAETKKWRDRANDELTGYEARSMRYSICTWMGHRRQSIRRVH